MSWEPGPPRHRIPVPAFFIAAMVLLVSGVAGYTHRAAIGDYVSGAQHRPDAIDPAASRVPTGASGCRPPPCVNSDGLNVFVTSVDRDAALATGTRQHTGKHVVLVTIRWEYHGDKTGDANPIGFGLIGADRIKANPALDCAGVLGWTDWSSAEIADGGSYGPNTLCFPSVGGDPTGDLTLLWRHNLFGDDAKMPLGSAGQPMG